MKNTISFLIMLCSVSIASYGQVSSVVLSQLRVHTSYDLNDSNELEVSFEVNDPEKVTSIKVTLANDEKKDISEVITLSSEGWHLWTRGELKVIVFQVAIPVSLTDNCRYFEAYAIDNKNVKSNIVESPVH